jgi:hypothetical protein
LLRSVPAAVRLIRSAIVLKPSTLLHLHHVLIQRQYRLLFSKGRRKPGPKGPSQELMDAIVATKQRNPSWGCPRIAQQIALAFGVPVDKDLVRRILAGQYSPKPGAGAPSWLTFLAQMKDSLWSADLFAANRQGCELTGFWSSWISTPVASWGSACSPAPSTASRFAECSTTPFKATAPCRNTSVPTMIRFIVPLNGKLRILDVAEIKTVPYVPWSHPFVERLIGTLRRGCLDRTLFCTTADLESKLVDFKAYFNHHRAHRARLGRPVEDARPRPIAKLQSYRWECHCRGLYQTPTAA